MTFRKPLVVPVLAVTAASTVIPAIPYNVQAAQQQASFSDVSLNDYFYSAVSSLAGSGVITGYKDGTFRPYESVTRAQAAKMIALALGLDTNNVKDPALKDVPKSEWYYGPIAALIEAGIIKGYEDGTFKPQNAITRAQMAKMIVLGFQFKEKKDNLSNFKDVPANDWYAGYVGALLENGITTGQTSTIFAPYSSVTRGQLAAFIFRSERAHLQETNIKVQQVSDTSLITTEGKSYILSSQVKNLLNSQNAPILRNASIQFETVDSTITKITYLNLMQNGTKTENLVLDGKNGILEGNLHIKGDFVSVKNLTITGNLHIEKELENSFYAYRVKVQGNVFISGKSEANSSKIAAHLYKAFPYKLSSQMITNAETKQESRLIFEDAELKSMEINKNDVRVESKGKTTIQDMTISARAAIIAEQNTIISKITLKDGAKATFGEKIKVPNLILPEGADVKAFIENYSNVKENIEKINGKANNDVVQNPGGSSSGGGGSSSGPNIGSELLVQSVQPLNALEIEVKFNTTVNQEDAEKAALYSVKNSAGTPLAINKVELKDDKQTAVIKLAAGSKLDHDKYYDVKVDATGSTLWSTSGQRFSKTYEITFKFSDTALASLSAVKYNNIQEAQVEFSKPMTQLPASNVKVYNGDGEVVTGEAVVKGMGIMNAAGEKKLVVDLTAAVIDKEYTIKVFGAADISGNTLPTQTFTVKRAAKTDDIKPTLSNIEVLANNKLKLTFSERVVKDAADSYGDLTVPAGIVTLKNGSAGLSKDVEVNEGGTQITVTLTDGKALAGGLNAVSVNNFYDFSLNQQQTEQSKVVTVVESEPKVSSVSVANYKGNDVVVVKFDQQVRLVSPAPASVFTAIKYYEGSVEKTHATGFSPLANTASLYDPDGDGKSDAIAVNVNAANVKEAQYSVDLSAGVVTDVYGNLNKSKAGLSFTYQKIGSISKPEVLDNDPNTAGVQPIKTLQADGMENEITIKFTNVVSAATALNIYNYLIDGTAAFEKATFVGDASTVRLTLKQGIIKETTTYAFTVQNVANPSGNVMDAVTFAQVFTENVAPEVKNAELVASNAIKITATEDLSGASASDFELYIGGMKVNNAFSSTVYSGSGINDGTFVGGIGKESFTLQLNAALTTSDLAKSIEIKVVKDTATEDNSRIKNNLKGEVTVTVKK